MLGLPSRLGTDHLPEVAVDARPRPVDPPEPEVVPHRAAGRKVVRELAPGGIQSISCKGRRSRSPACRPCGVSSRASPLVSEAPVCATARLSGQTGNACDRSTCGRRIVGQSATIAENLAVEVTFTTPSKTGIPGTSASPRSCALRHRRAVVARRCRAVPPPSPMSAGGT